MIKIENKTIENKGFSYLTEQINIGENYKKIQVYIGKNIPKNLELHYNKLQKKETELILKNITNLFELDAILDIKQYEKIEKIRIELKYLIHKLTDYQRNLLWRKFAIKFIFESNAIEGSKLSENEVSSIIKKGGIALSKKREVIEVNNSIKAFEFIKSKNFILNQKNIIKLHKIVVLGLDIEEGYKKTNIIVNNKDTVPAGKVRENMAELLDWWRNQKKSTVLKKRSHPFFTAISFHRSFEHIHPFSDGNGRVGRLIYIWMLQKSGYGIILFENKNRQSYFSALDQADEGRPKKLYYHCIRAYKNTLKYLLSNN